MDNRETRTMAESVLRYGDRQLTEQEKETLCHMFRDSSAMERASIVARVIRRGLLQDSSPGYFEKLFSSLSAAENISHLVSENDYVLDS